MGSNIYYKDDNPEIMLKLDSFFYDCDGDKEKLIKAAISLNSEHGKELLKDLLDSVEAPEYDLSAESIEKKIDGYSIVSFTHGSMGYEIVESIIEFINNLVPQITIQACGWGDEDPFEYWLKYENGQLITKADSPFESEDEDTEIKNTIYKWWHSGLPASISEGLLNEDVDDDEDEDDESYIKNIGLWSLTENLFKSDMNSIASNIDERLIFGMEISKIMQLLREDTNLHDKDDCHFFGKHDDNKELGFQSGYIYNLTFEFYVNLENICDIDFDAIASHFNKLPIERTENYQLVKDVWEWGWKVEESNVNLRIYKEGSTYDETTMQLDIGVLHQHN